MKSKLIKKLIYSIVMTLILFTIYININQNFYVERKTISLIHDSKHLIVREIDDMKQKNFFLAEKYHNIDKRLVNIFEENNQILTFLYFDMSNIKLKMIQFAQSNGISFRENLNFLNYNLKNTLIEEGVFKYNYYVKNFENNDKNSSDKFEDLFHEYFYENNYKLINKLKKNNDLIMNFNNQVLSTKELKNYNDSLKSFTKLFEDIDYNLFTLSKENYYPFYQNKFYVLIIIQIFSYLLLSQIFLFTKKNK